MAASISAERSNFDVDDDDDDDVCCCWGDVDGVFVVANAAVSMLFVAADVHDDDDAGDDDDDVDVGVSPSRTKTTAAADAVLWPPAFIEVASKPTRPVIGSSSLVVVLVVGSAAVEHFSAILCCCGVESASAVAMSMSTRS